MQSHEAVVEVEACEGPCEFAQRKVEPNKTSNILSGLVYKHGTDSKLNLKPRQANIYRAFNWFLTPHHAYPTPTNPPKLLDQVQAVLRTKHYSIRTERVYLDWIKRDILFHHKTHPAQMGAAEVEAFLSHLAVVGKVAASTQNQAKSALLFLYREVLALELPWLENVTRAKTPQRLPVVLTVSEVKSVLNRLNGALWLMASLLYGGGLRLMECVRLRVKDVDFEMRQVTVREGKGFKDRVTMLPESLIAPYARFTINDPPPPPGTSPKASGRAMPVPPSDPASRPGAKTRRYG